MFTFILALEGVEGEIFHWQSIVQVVTAQWGEVSENREKWEKDGEDEQRARSVENGCRTKSREVNRARRVGRK